MMDGGGSKTPVRTLTSIWESCPGDEASADQPTDADQQSFAEGQAAQLAPSGTQHGKDRQAAPAFGEPDCQDDSTSAGSEEYGEYELESGQAGEVDGGQA
jgi:hypothetical protein